MKGNSSNKRFHERYNLFFIIKILFRFFPYYFKHFIIYKSQKSIPEIGYRKDKLNLFTKMHRALYDAMYNIVIDGYLEHTGLKVSKDTFIMIFFLRQFIASLDDELEEQLANDRFNGLEALLESKSVSVYLNYIKQYQVHQKCEHNIAGHLTSWLGLEFDRYICLTRNTVKSYNIEHILECNNYDSGMWLEVLTECVALFNDHNQLDTKTIKDLNFCGNACKLADELVDIRRDVKELDPNVMVAILEKYPVEKKVFLKEMNSKKWLCLKWWLKNCPESTDEFFGLVDEFYNSISSSKLKLVCYMSFLPAIIGYDFEVLGGIKD